MLSKLSYQTGLREDFQDFLIPHAILHLYLTRSNNLILTDLIDLGIFQ